MTVDRLIPMTRNRAATAVVQCRLHLERARAEARLAIDILSDTLPEALEPLQRFLGCLEESERALAGVREPT